MPPGFRRDAGLADAEEARARWACPRGAGELPPDLAAEARHVASITGTPEAHTCPLAVVEHASPWVVEVTRAVALASDWHVPVAETLGRDLARVDLQALAALQSARGAAWESDQQIREQRAKKPGGGAR